MFRFGWVALIAIVALADSANVTSHGVPLLLGRRLSTLPAGPADRQFHY